MTAKPGPYEVLIVDDDLPAAETYAQLVYGKTGLTALTTSSPDEAIEAIRAHPIKVAVLDQRMPATSGTDLLPRLLKIDDRIRAILLTGQAAYEDVTAAVGRFQVFLRKNDVKLLPTKVLAEYAEYLDAAGPTRGEPIFSFRRGLPGRRFKVEYHLVLITVVDDEFIPEEAWKTVIQVNSGETKAQSETVTLADEFSVTKEESMSMAATLGLKGSQLQPFETSLRSEISQRLGVAATTRSERTITHEEEYSIAPEAGDGSIRARAYQQAPIFRRLNVAITKRCTCCDGSATTTFRVLQEVQRRATRQIDFKSDGEQSIHRTGYLEVT